MSEAQAYQITYTAKEVEELLDKMNNMEQELVNSDNPVTSKAVLAKFEELKKAVSDGKKLVASAITEKGVSTATENTFTEMASNILAISTGGDNSFKIVISEKTNVEKEKYIAEDGTTFNDLLEYLLYKIKKVSLISSLLLNREIIEVIATEIEMEETVI